MNNHASKTLFVSMLGAALLVGATASAQVAPPNDSVASATVIAATPYTLTEDTAGATADPSDPVACAGDGSRSVWFAYTATTSGSLQADTAGADYDTVLGVFSAGPGGLVPVDCNDDSQCSFQSTVVFNAVAGQTYYFRVTNYASYSRMSSLTFNLGLPSAPPAPLTANVTLDSSAEVSAATGVVRVSGTVTCSQSAFYNLFIAAQQNTGRGTTAGSAFVGGPCGPTPTPWSATFQSFSGRFVGGALTVAANGSAYSYGGTCGGSNYTSLSAGGTTILRGTALKEILPGATMCFRPPSPSSGNGASLPPPPPR